MKLFIVVAVCTALLAAVDGNSFKKDCVRMDINGTVTVTATVGNATKSAVIDLTAAKPTVTANCSQQAKSMMTVTFQNNAVWELTFTNTKDKVALLQTVSFKPDELFNDTTMSNDSVTVADKVPMDLMSSKGSYECDSQTTVTFSSKEGNITFEVVQSITSLRVQAFGLPKNESFSPAEHCSKDVTTAVPTTTEATTAPPPTPASPTPAPKETFVVKDSKGVVCFRMEAGLQFFVEYENKDKKMVLSKSQIISDKAMVSGTCANATVKTATMVISQGDDYSLTIEETRTKSSESSALTLSVNLTSAQYPDALTPGKVVTFHMTTFKQNVADTYYRCDSLDRKPFDNSTTTLFTNDVKMQAFGLKNGSFSGSGARCTLDPTPSPIPPATTPGDNTYSVDNKYHNVTCIVLTGEISFSNVTYVTKNKTVAQALPIVIPAMGGNATQNVTFKGDCDLEGGKAQSLEITFNGNWTLQLTFATMASSSDMLEASDQYSVRDIVFIYDQNSDFFPGAENPSAPMNANLTNITTGFMKGSSGGGSYRCDADQSETIGDGILFQTAKLQYKAFNADNSTTFNKDKVAECSADDESNSIVPIAVGAALAGLVAIVLIAYLIGRRRSRRQGYESV